MLTTVTITGADDEVDPHALAKLSAEFPFVEWGILMSPRREGAPRYPTKNWVERLTDFTAGGMELSAHFCGACARDTLAGDSKWLDALPVAFSRVQINGFDGNADGIVEMTHEHRLQEIIFQVGSEDLLLSASSAVSRIESRGGGASVLWDPSGGRGIEAKSWPSPSTWLAMGYAGGIGPGNVEAVLRELDGLGRDYWIDMESGVRTGNQFDLGLVRQVLEKARPFVKEGCR